MEYSFKILHCAVSPGKSGEGCRQMQKVLRIVASLRLVPRLSDLFDHFVWKHNSNRGQDRARLPGRLVNYGHIAEGGLDIPVLRIVRSLIEYTQRKHVMLSRREYSQLKRGGSARLVARPGGGILERSLVCTESEGTDSSRVTIGVVFIFAT
ncbi:hypothetical protein HPB48_012971 [Haemaphysalis longicornis]|uniref:Uncharacterized protein n=1 Tax=Haemaphysalis longicornis TaxID=44386 RepID=A0A9J6FQ75_HAELO|nr:hypothetical protein HPB48_012971 [Haemaphysalis longicornis]